MYYNMNPNILPKICLLNTVVINPPYVHRKRRADEYIIYIIKNGEMFIKENDIDYHLVQGDVLILDPDYRHEGIKASYCEYYYIHFRHDDMKRECAKVVEEKENVWTMIRNHALQSNSFSYEMYETERLLLPKYFHFANQSSFTGLMHLLNDAMEENKTQLENYKIKCSCKALDAFIQIERNFISSRMKASGLRRAKAFAKVQDILNRINTDYANCYSSQVIEEQFQCNFDYINRIFKKTTGSTIFSYLNQVRIDHAKVLILTTSLTITEIGEKVGFLDIYYFSKVFKKHTGVSPTMFGNGVLRVNESLKE